MLFPKHDNHELITELRARGLVIIAFGPEDLQAVDETLSYETACATLDWMADHLEQRVTEVAWDIIETLLTITKEGA